MPSSSPSPSSLTDIQAVTFSMTLTFSNQPLPRVTKSAEHAPSMPPTKPGPSHDHRDPRRRSFRGTIISLILLIFSVAECGTAFQPFHLIRRNKNFWIHGQDFVSATQQQPRVALSPSRRRSTRRENDGMEPSPSMNAKNNDNGNDIDDSDSANVDADPSGFSSWMEGLTQWPRYPGPGSDTTDRDAKSLDEILSANVDSNDRMEKSQTNRDLSRSNESTVSFGDSSVNDSSSKGVPLERTTGPRNESFQPRGSPTSTSLSPLNRYRGINPLSNFIKFEAILDLAAGVSNETEPYFSSVFAAADRLFQLSKQQWEQEDVSLLEALELDEQNLVQDEDGIVDQASLVANVTTVEDLLSREQYFGSLPFILDSDFVTSASMREQAMASTANVSNLPMNQVSLAKAAESLLKDTTSRIEDLVAEASSALSPDSVQDLIVRASKVFTSSTSSINDTEAINKRIEAVSNNIFQAVQRIAKDGVVDTQFAADLAREAASMAAVANIVLGAGYAYGSRSGATGMEGTNPLLDELWQGQQPQQSTNDIVAGDDSPMLKPLFVNFASAERIEPFEYDEVILKGAEMGVLAGAIYEETLPRCKKVGHSLVANGTTANVAWMVTDSVDSESNFMIPHDDEVDSRHSLVQYNQKRHGKETVLDRPIFVRTITIRGFDASDATVDREQILNEICTAYPESLSDETPGILLHSGLLAIAKQIYADTKKYIDWMSPNHRLVLNGHSVGGSLSILMLLHMVTEEGIDYVLERILRVYTHGSPPIAAKIGRRQGVPESKHSCSILEEIGLPADIVYNYIQPYDPIVRLFTRYDPLYPLVDDLGADEVTLYAKGPRRSLRPIARGIFQAWEGWSRFREVWKGTTNQEYRSVGIQLILLPDPLRYLNDRFLSVNVGVPPTEAVVRISSEELLVALNGLFPLDAFLISQVPQAVRSFLHHFYPAYDSTILNYATKVGKSPTRSSLLSSISRKPFGSDNKAKEGRSNGAPTLLAGKTTSSKNTRDPLAP